MATEFQIGDKVSYLGWVGHVTGIMPNADYPLKCGFKDESGTVEEHFTLDGRLDIKHNKSALRLLERSKKVKKKLYPAIFHTSKDNSYYIAPRLFESEKEAEAKGEFVQLLLDWVVEVEI